MSSSLSSTIVQPRETAAETDQAQAPADLVAKARRVQAAQSARQAAAAAALARAGQFDPLQAVIAPLAEPAADENQQSRLAKEQQAEIERRAQNANADLADRLSAVSELIALSVLNNTQGYRVIRVTIDELLQPAVDILQKWQAAATATGDEDRYDYASAVRDETARVLAGSRALQTVRSAQPLSESDAFQDDHVGVLLALAGAIAYALDDYSRLSRAARSNVENSYVRHLFAGAADGRAPPRVRSGDDDQSTHPPCQFLSRRACDALQPACTFVPFDIDNCGDDGVCRTTGDGGASVQTAAEPSLQVTRVLKQLAERQGPVMVETLRNLYRSTRRFAIERASTLGVTSRNLVSQLGRYSARFAVALPVVLATGYLSMSAVRALTAPFASASLRTTQLLTVGAAGAASVMAMRQQLSPSATSSSSSTGAPARRAQAYDVPLQQYVRQKVATAPKRPRRVQR